MTALPQHLTSTTDLWPGANHSCAAEVSFAPLTAARALTGLWGLWDSVTLGQPGIVAYLFVTSYDFSKRRNGQGRRSRTQKKKCPGLTQTQSLVWIIKECIQKYSQYNQRKQFEEIYMTFITMHKNRKVDWLGRWMVASLCWKQICISF